MSMSFSFLAVLAAPVQAGGRGCVRLCLCLSLGAGLSACDQLGIETPQKAAERQVADAKAVGSACRHALRAIEDCYTLNPKADKASVFAGWREMDEYMRENKLEGIAPVVPRPGAKPKTDEEEAAAPAKTSEKAGDKAAEKVAEKVADKSGAAAKAH